MFECWGKNDSLKLLQTYVGTMSVGANYCIGEITKNTEMTEGGHQKGRKSPQTAERVDRILSDPKRINWDPAGERVPKEAY